MSELQADFEKAIAIHQAGDLREAESLYRRLLEDQPAHWDTLYLLGTALLQLGNFRESIKLMEQVVQARPDVPDAYNNLGVAYKALGRWQDAANALQAAIKVNPEYHQAFFNLGALMEDRGLFADAEKCFRQAIHLDPNDFQSQFRLGNVLKAQQKWEEAEACYRELVDQQPDNLDLLINLGFVLARQERLKDAATVYKQILHLRPDYHEIHNNLSYLYERQGKLGEAVENALHALELAPNYPEGYNNLGTALRSMHQLDEACEAYRKAVALRPGFALAEFNLGTTKLLQGDFRRGWPGYERRHETLDSPPRQFQQPRWEGQPIIGKKLLVHADQGFGDTLQFLRFLPLAREQSQATLILECQPELQRLLANHPHIETIVAEGDPLTPFDFEIPLASLGNVLNIELANLPADVPYLSPPAELRDDLAQLLQTADASAFKVGLMWQGNPQQARDIVRSCPLETLAPLADVAGAAYFSLQLEGVDTQLLANVHPQWQLVDLGSHFEDFADTAAAISQLDLLITVDTAVAHLAGALGRPVWTLLAHTPDWRWLLERDDCPWYPTMRLFRQPRWGDWKTVVQTVTNELNRRP